MKDDIDCHNCSISMNISVLKIPMSRCCLNTSITQTKIDVCVDLLIY